MGILDGKNIVVTGVLTDASLAYGVAKLALAEGAQVMLTGAGRGLSITERTARKLSTASGKNVWQSSPALFYAQISESHHYYLGQLASRYGLTLILRSVNR